MNKIIGSLLVLTFLYVGSAFALPVLDAGFEWTSSSYWTPTDLTTAEDGEVFSLIYSEDASYEADFGIFTVDDLNDPSSITEKFEIFSYDQGESDTDFQSVYFKYETSIWSVSKDESTWTAFDSVFGFYFDVHNGGLDDPEADYSYYSDSQFNDPVSEVGVDHILIAFDGTNNAKLYLDDQILALPADRDYNDMVVVANDVAPVPEPGTLLLLGSGLVGLAFLKRRKS